MNWNNLQYFLVLARTKNLTKSSKKMNCSQSTISRRIKNLEDEIGDVLFKHSPYGYELNELGKQLLEYAISLEEQIYNIRNNLLNPGIDKQIKIRFATAETIANHILIPEFANFLDANKNISLDVITGIDSVSLLEYDLDIALRLVRPKQNTLKVMRVGVMSSGLYISNELHPIIDDNIKFITWDNNPKNLMAVQWLEKYYPGHEVVFTANNLQSQLIAVLNSVGVAILPCFLGDKYHNLVNILDDGISLKEDIWLVSKFSTKESPEIIKFKKHLIDIIDNKIY